jgi:NAD-dependent SIR2 family protein deacetylase
VSLLPRIGDFPGHSSTRGAKWKHRRPIQYQDFVRSELVRKRYWARSLVGWRRFSEAKPNPAHYALVRLEATGYLHQLVTQNVDGLHQKAGSRRVIDLHGRLDTVECLICYHRRSRAVFQALLEEQNPVFRALTASDAPDGDAKLEGMAFERFQIPSCPECGGVLKPTVVFFGDSVPRPRVERALMRLAEADGLLVVGSSLRVVSGYRFCRAALEQGKPIAAINLGRTRADGDITLKVVASCTKVLPALVERLGM